jgi:membrane protein YdbS with pleckstrin-like domain
VPGQWLPEEGVRSLEKYVVPDEESLVFVIRRHWVTLAEPIATTVASAIVMVFVIGALGQKFPEMATVVFILWLAVLARGIYLAVEWSHTWFGATHRRLMLLQGLVTRKIAMMPLEKVTDMSYSRSPLGQLLGYGEFVLESAGQEQALRSVDFIPYPDELYRILLATMFGRKTAAKNIAAAKQQVAEPFPKPTPQREPWPESRPITTKDIFRPHPGAPPLPEPMIELFADAEPTVQLPSASPDSPGTHDNT